VSRASTAWGEALLAADTARVGDVETLSLDETLFARRGAAGSTACGSRPSSTQLAASASTLSGFGLNYARTELPTPPYPPDRSTGGGGC